MFDRSIPMVGFHTILAEHEGVPAMLRLIREGLAPMGFNTLILEARYAFRCFPEYAEGSVTAEDCGVIASACEENGIRLVPLLPCLSHQSWKGRGRPFPFLAAHPELLECPDVDPDVEWPDFALHSWCAANDDVWQYVFPMIDDLADACRAKAFHVGLDELFEIGRCPRCKGQDVAKLFARTVKILHDHLAARGLDMMMWGDRLLDAKALGMSMWEADREGVHPAIDMAEEVTRDIIICDWHYELHSHGYFSIEEFMTRGFFVVPSFFHKPECAQHFWLHCLEYIYLGKKRGWPGKLGGLLCTQWSPMCDEIADNILAGIRGEDAEGRGAGVGKVIAAVVPKGRFFRK